MNSDNLLATPMEAVDLEGLVGKRVRYVDKNEKIWPGIIKAVEDPFVIIKLDEFPSGLGQGQIVEILDDSEA